MGLATKALAGAAAAGIAAAAYYYYLKYYAVEKFDSTGKTVEELTAWLHAHGVDTSEWGTGTRKTVKKFLEEMEKKESTLIYTNGMALRCVEVAKVLVKREGSTQVLVETHEIKPDGKKKMRGAPLSEKMFAGEDPIIAGARGVKEEIGMDCVSEPGVRVIQKIDKSASFPTLLGRYTVYEVSVVVPGISDKPFETKEPSAAGDRTHCWAWKEASEITDDKPQG